VSARGSCGAAALAQLLALKDTAQELKVCFGGIKLGALDALGDLDGGGEDRRRRRAPRIAGLINTER